jgi:hypothetical protein
LGDTKHYTHRAQGGIACALSIRDGLKVVIVLLTKVEDSTIADLVPCKGRDIGELDPIRTEESEVLNDEGNGIGPRRQWVLNPCVHSMVVIAPVALTEAVVAAKKDPIAQGSREAVLCSHTGAGNDLRHHWVMDHLAAVGYTLVLADCIRHDGDKVDGNTNAGRRKPAAGVAVNCLMDVSHQGGMPDEQLSPLIVSPQIKETA